MDLGNALDTMRATREAHNATKTPTAVEVGGAATIIFYSDRKAATIVEVVLWKSGPRAGTPRTVRVQEDTSTRTDGNGMSDCQRYTHERNPNGQIHAFKFAKGTWCNTGTRLAIGWRDAYYDYSF